MLCLPCSAPINRTTDRSCVAQSRRLAMPLLLCLTHPKKREVLLHLSREKKIEFQERIYNQHDVGSSHEPWSCSSQPIYSLRSANVVMQSSEAKDLLFWRTKRKTDPSLRSGDKS